MKDWISCGQYDCCIVGSEELIKSAPTYRLKNDHGHSSYSETIIIRLEKRTTGWSNELPEGWTTQKTNGILEAIYTHGGKVIFSIQLVVKNEVIVCFRKAIDSYVRIGIHYGLMLALYQRSVGQHGVTLLCGNEIIILSAASGTGKTTLAKLLEKHCDAIVINGDFALLTPTEDGVIFEPTPFCGTSRRALNHRFRVNRVVFLGQAKDNRWRTLDGREAITRFLNNAFVPKWDSKMLQAVQENILKCVDAVKVNAFDFAPTQEAAEEFLKRIEEDSTICLG